MAGTRRKSFFSKFLIFSLVMHGVIVGGIIYGASIAPPPFIQGDSIMVNFVDLRIDARASAREVKGDKFDTEKRSIPNDPSRKDNPGREVTISIKKNVSTVHEALGKANPVVESVPEAIDKGEIIRKIQHTTPESNLINGMEVMRSYPYADSGLEPSARVIPPGGSPARTPDPVVSAQEVQKYLDDIRKQIERAKQYPRMARMRGFEGTSLVTFKITLEGRVEEVGIARSSSYQILDEAAMSTVRQAAPFPSFPSDLKAKQLQLSIPLIFEIQ